MDETFVTLARDTSIPFDVGAVFFPPRSKTREFTLRSVPIALDHAADRCSSAESWIPVGARAENDRLRVRPRGTAGPQGNMRRQLRMT